MSENSALTTEALIFLLANHRPHGGWDQQRAGDLLIQMKVGAEETKNLRRAASEMVREGFCAACGRPFPLTGAERQKRYLERQKDKKDA